MAEEQTEFYWVQCQIIHLVPYTPHSQTWHWLAGDTDVCTTQETKLRARLSLGQRDVCCLNTHNPAVSAARLGPVSSNSPSPSGGDLQLHVTGQPWSHTGGSLAAVSR